MFFNKNSQEDPNKQLTSGMLHCPCKNEQGLFITNRHASWAVSLAIVWSFFVFISGYFLGQRTVLEQFATRLEQDSLSDKIYSSLCTLYEVDNEAEVNDNDSDNAAEGEETTIDSSVEITESEGDDSSNGQKQVQQPAVQVAESAAQAPVKETKKYYAPLAGFGSAEHAYAFANRCNKKNIKVVVKKKPSKSSKGRTHYWYQVVTNPYDDKQVLATAVDTIKRAEHLRDVRILEA
jgi:hypothetical protein